MTHDADALQKWSLRQLYDALRNGADGLRKILPKVPPIQRWLQAQREFQDTWFPAAKPVVERFEKVMEGILPFTHGAVSLELAKDRVEVSGSRSGLVAELLGTGEIRATLVLGVLAKDSGNLLGATREKVVWCTVHSLFDDFWARTRRYLQAWREALPHIVDYRAGEVHLANTGVFFELTPPPPKCVLLCPQTYPADDFVSVLQNWPYSNRHVDDELRMLGL